MVKPEILRSDAVRTLGQYRSAEDFHPSARGQAPAVWNLTWVTEGTRSYCTVYIPLESARVLFSSA